MRDGPPWGPESGRWCDAPEYNLNAGKRDTEPPNDPLTDVPDECEPCCCADCVR